MMVTWQFVAVAITVAGAILAGAMRFASMEARLNIIETIHPVWQAKLDFIASSVARIEGRMEVQRDLHLAERKEDDGKRR